MHRVIGLESHQSPWFGRNVVVCVPSVEVQLAVSPKLMVNIARVNS